MSSEKQKELGKILWAIADDLRGTMNADDFRDYMLSFLFLRYLSGNYEKAAKKELRGDYPKTDRDNKQSPLSIWYDEQEEEDIIYFEKQMRKKTHYVLKPKHLWSYLAELARTQSDELHNSLEDAFKYIENKSFSTAFNGLFSEINLNSEKLGKDRTARNKNLCKIITKIAEGLDKFSNDSDVLGDAYEYLIGQFAAGSGKKAGEFYTPQQVSTILSYIVSLDCQNPSSGKKKKLINVLDFACGSGSLLLNVRHQMGEYGIGKIYGQEKNITTFNLARMNMLLHGVKDDEFEIYHGDSLTNEWSVLAQRNPSKKIYFDAIVANPPFSLRWEVNDELNNDFRFKDYGLAPKSAADFAFLLHGFHFLSNNGTMAIILPHGILFRGGAEAKIRTKFLKDDNIDAIIGLPSKLFFSTGIPVCILVLKKCRRSNDILFINASEYFTKGKRQNYLKDDDIKKIVNTYQFRKEEKRYSCAVTLEEIEKNDFNLNISRYVSTAKPEIAINLDEVHSKLKGFEKDIKKHKNEHNSYLKELGLPLID